MARAPRPHRSRGDGIARRHGHGRLEMDERFCDVGRGITLCYEPFGDPDDPPLLLVMGLGVQMTGWHEDFCTALAGRGFHVVRFDNRDVGRSTHTRLRPPSLLQLATRRFEPPVHVGRHGQGRAGLLRALDLAPAHIVGVSMGGMIAQTIAAQEPISVRSLVSIMSNTGNRWRGQPALDGLSPRPAARPARQGGYVEHTLRLFEAIGSPGMIDADDMRERARALFRAGPQPRRHRPPARGDPRLGRSHLRASEHPCADPGDPRLEGQAHPSLRRACDGRRHPRSRADHDRRHGPRSAASTLAAPDRQDRRPRRARRPGHRHSAGLLTVGSSLMSRIATAIALALLRCAPPVPPARAQRCRRSSTSSSS